jgi:hypothetical protein
MHEITDEGARKLAAAIIRPVVREYKQAVNRYVKNPKNKIAQRKVLELRDWFMSEWFSIISMGVDGEAAIRSIELKAEKERERMRRRKQKL